MVTVLVERREFGEKRGSAIRHWRNAKPGGEPAAEQPPAASPRRRDPSSSSEQLTPGDRYRQISVFAYYKAEQRGFAPGHMWDDWLAAERAVDSRIESGSVKAPAPDRRSIG